MLRYFPAILSLMFFLGIQMITSQEVADTVEMIKTVTGMHNVKITENKETYVYTNSYEKMETIFQHFCDVSRKRFDIPAFQNDTVAFVLIGREIHLHVWRDDYWFAIGDNDKKRSDFLCTFSVSPNGSVIILPRFPGLPFKFQSLESATAFGDGGRILNTRLSWTQLNTELKLKLPASVRFLMRESTATTLAKLESTTLKAETTEMTETMHSETVPSKRFLRDKWWLIVDMGSAIIIVNGIISGIFIGLLLRLSTATESVTVSTTSEPQMSEMSNATITFEQQQK
uniref:DsbC domain-containing protein n=1 Tax=Panagrellus redivivus TaxID=6233 RepID=A0A7E4V3P5_PANRE